VQAQPVAHFSVGAFVIAGGLKHALLSRANDDRLHAAVAACAARPVDVQRARSAGAIGAGHDLARAAGGLSRIADHPEAHSRRAWLASHSGRARRPGRSHVPWRPWRPRRAGRPGGPGMSRRSGRADFAFRPGQPRRSGRSGGADCAGFALGSRRSRGTLGSGLAFRSLKSGRAGQARIAFGPRPPVRARRSGRSSRTGRPGFAVRPPRALSSRVALAAPAGPGRPCLPWRSRRQRSARPLRRWRQSSALVSSPSRSPPARMPAPDYDRRVIMRASLKPRRTRAPSAHSRACAVTSPSPEGRRMAEPRREAVQSDLWRLRAAASQIQP
jgi:hypothetical protein